MSDAKQAVAAIAAGIKSHLGADPAKPELAPEDVIKAINAHPVIGDALAKLFAVAIDALAQRIHDAIAGKSAS